MDIVCDEDLANRYLAHGGHGGLQSVIRSNLGVLALTTYCQSLTTSFCHEPNMESSPLILQSPSDAGGAQIQLVIWTNTFCNLDKCIL